MGDPLAFEGLKTKQRGLRDSFPTNLGLCVYRALSWLKHAEMNRAQIIDGAAIMGVLLPLFIDIMMDNPEQPWGAPYYPFVE